MRADLTTKNCVLGDHDHDFKVTMRGDCSLGFRYRNPGSRDPTQKMSSAAIASAKRAWRAGNIGVLDCLLRRRHKHETQWYIE